MQNKLVSIQTIHNTPMLVAYAVQLATEACNV